MRVAVALGLFLAFSTGTEAFFAPNSRRKHVARESAWLKRRGTLLAAWRLRGGGGDVKEAATLEQLDGMIAAAGESLVVLDFSAAWCSPCETIAPVFSALSEEMADATFVKVDVDANPDAASKFDVFQMPTFLFIKNGEVLDRFSGANAAVLRARVAELLGVDETISTSAISENPSLSAGSHADAENEAAGEAAEAAAPAGDDVQDDEAVEGQQQQQQKEEEGDALANTRHAAVEGEDAVGESETAAEEAAAALDQEERVVDEDVAAADAAAAAAEPLEEQDADEAAAAATAVETDEPAVCGEAAAAAIDEEDAGAGEEAAAAGEGEVGAELPADKDEIEAEAEVAAEQAEEVIEEELDED